MEKMCSENFDDNEDNANAARDFHRTCTYAIRLDAISNNRSKLPYTIFQLQKRCIFLLQLNSLRLLSIFTFYFPLAIP